MMSGVNVGARAGMRMVDIMNIGVATWALRAQIIGPAVRNGSCRREAGLGEHVASPQRSVWVVKGDRAGGKVWVD